jgi:hypothetical protein
MENARLLAASNAAFTEVSVRPVGSSENRLYDAHGFDEQNISVPSRGPNRRCGIEYT